MDIRTRFAPSPTGYLHIGGLRTAYYNYLFAKKNKGKLILRIEDTDQERYVHGSIEALIKTLKTMGIEYDEGPILDNDKIADFGENGPYVQSKRLGLYREFAKQLVDSGHAYYCFCTKDRLAQVRHQQELAKLPTKYDRHCLHLSPDQIQEHVQAGDPYVIRLKVPEGETGFDDVIRGRITIGNQEVDDQVLLKSDGFPTYHLAVVIDDHQMGITHIIRGEEWLPSTPKHVILYQAFDWQIPAFAHLPLILNPDKTKLSKRQGDVAVEDFLAKGYLPEALINFVALLGFNPKDDQEIYSRQELEQLFNLEKVNKSGAVFNIDKLNWLNEHYLRAKSEEELLDLIVPLLKSNQELPSREVLIKIIAVEKSRMTLVNDVVDRISDYQGLPEYESEILVWKKSTKEDAAQQIHGLLIFIESLTDDNFTSVDLLEQAIKGYIKDNNLDNGSVLWPTRVALSGKSASPSPFELLWVIGREQGMARLKQALRKLES
ncbi:glutamate--tRNA ligase [Patescibacteria group bacterium]|nr:glutamate--tRNA ligase [Patescibacteria group bacterium]MBU1705321.1 glutamate--tRNA ligase [Patescibacteria group bacterium]